MTTVLEQLRQLADEEKWLDILDLQREATTMTGPAADRAWALYWLGRAYWYAGRDEFDLTAAIRHTREAARLDPLGGQALKSLGAYLVTMGRYHDGRRILQAWIARFNEWTPKLQASLADVQYNLGYAARYEGDLDQAELWYGEALANYEQIGNQEWAYLTSCALAQVIIRQGNLKVAEHLLRHLPAMPQYEGYRLKAMTELLAAAGDHKSAQPVANMAADRLLELADKDPWELAELHLLLANIHDLAGNLAERDQHAEAARDALYISPRHTLYRAACMLLDHHNIKEAFA